MLPCRYPNALTNPLPAVPSFSMYHLYGTGLPAERAYHYVMPPGWDLTPDGTILSEPAPKNTTPSTANATSTDAAEDQLGSCKAAADAAGEQPGGACAAGSENEDITINLEAARGTYEWRMNTVLTSAEYGVVRMDSGALLLAACRDADTIRLFLSLSVCSDLLQQPSQQTCFGSSAGASSAAMPA